MNTILKQIYRIESFKQGMERHYQPFQWESADRWQKPYTSVVNFVGEPNRPQ